MPKSRRPKKRSALFAHEGITAGICRAFVIYLASHIRPVHEVLFRSLRDIRNECENNFKGMTEEPIPGLRDTACTTAPAGLRMAQFEASKKEIPG